MPELPEVETIVRNTRDLLIGRRVMDFRTHWARNSSPSAAAVRKALRGRTITSVRRRAKFIVWELDDGGVLTVHLRMSGRFEWSGENGSKRPSHVRAEFSFDSGPRLLFCDARKFGRIHYVRDSDALFASLGIEPLEAAFTIDALSELLRNRRRQLKPMLLDQSVIAGLGNIYTDEALHRAKLHPLRASDRLRAIEIERLHAAIRAALAEGVRRNGTTIDWVYPSGQMQDHLRAYGRTGEPCFECGTPIRRLVVGQRSTHICPRCQPVPRRIRRDAKDR